jgi:hypothetical protein
VTESIRWIIGAFILLNAIGGAVQAVGVARRKLAARRIRWPRPVDAILETLSWPLLALWLSALALFCASSILLVEANAATGPAFVAAFLLDALVFWRVQRRAAGSAYTARERLTRYVLFGWLAVAILGGRPLPDPFAPSPPNPDRVSHDGGRRGPLRPVA